MVYPGKQPGMCRLELPRHLKWCKTGCSFPGRRLVWGSLPPDIHTKITLPGSGVCRGQDRGLGRGLVYGDIDGGGF